MSFKKDIKRQVNMVNMQIADGFVTFMKSLFCF